MDEELAQQIKELITNSLKLSVHSYDDGDIEVRLSLVHQDEYGQTVFEKEISCDYIRSTKGCYN